MSAEGSTEERIETMVIKPAVVAAVGTGVGMLMTDMRKITINGTRYSLPMVMFGGLFVGSLIGNVAHDYVFPELHLDQKLEKPASAAFAMGATAAGQYGTLRLLADGAAENLGTSTIITGAVAGVSLGEYIYNNVLESLIMKKTT
jgi:hypothetical protein